MDLLGGWMMDLLTGILPDESVELLNSYVLSPQSPVQGFRRVGVKAFESAYNTMWPILMPALDRLAQAVYNSPDVLVVVYFLAAIFILLQAALWVHRFMMFWVKLIWRLFFWTSVVLIAAAVWQIGPEAVARQAIVVGSRIFGTLSAAVAIFQQEYQKYEAQQNNARGGPGTKYSSGTKWR